MSVLGVDGDSGKNGETQSRGLRIILRGHRHSVFPYPWPAQGDPAICQMTGQTEPAFRRTVAWRSVAVATVIILGVALLGPFVLINWHVSSPAIAITCGII